MDFVRSYFDTNEPLTGWTLLSSIFFQIRKGCNWSEIHLYQSNFLQNPYFNDIFDSVLNFWNLHQSFHLSNNKISFYVMFFKGGKISEGIFVFIPSSENNCLYIFTAQIFFRILSLHPVTVHQEVSIMDFLSQKSSESF